MQLRNRACTSSTRAYAGNTALKALTSSALAVPGLAGSAVADSPVAQPSADYNFSYYAEDPLSSSKVVDGGETERYDIEIHQFHVESPVTARTDLSLDIVHESMSGASPFYVLPDGDGGAVQVMSGASIKDERTDAKITGNLGFEGGNASVAAGVSVEDDYFAVNGSLAGEAYFDEKHTTLNGGIGFSSDEIKPSDSDRFILRPNDEYKHSFNLFGGLSRVIDRYSTVQTSLSYQHARGFLSDPYKAAFVENSLRADTRPDERNEFSWLTRYRRHFSRANGSFHLDYRFYADDWEITSHTAELAWYQSLWYDILFVPSFRYYTQEGAYFYETFYEDARSDGLSSSDYRLSPYGALSFRLKADATLPIADSDWRGTISWERYLSDSKLSLSKVDIENPGLVSFNLITVGISARF